MGESNRKNLRQSGQTPPEPAAVSRKQQQQRAQQRARRKKNLVIAAVVLAVFVILTPLTLLSTGAFYRVVPAATVGGQRYSIADFNYHYYSAFQSTYNSLQQSYGEYASYILDPQTSLDQQQFSEDLTWADYISNSALMNIQNVQLLITEAKAAGFALSPEQEAELSSLLDQLGTTAASYNYSLEGYLQAVYGNGMTKDIFQRNLRASYTADAFAASVTEGYQYDEAALQAHYETDKNAFDTVTFRLFYISGAAAEGGDADAAKAAAQEKAKFFAAAATDPEAFAALALEYAPEESKESYADPDATLNRNTRYSSLSGAVYADWLFDAARQPGDTTVMESGANQYVLYFEERGDNHYNTVNIRHLLITPESDEESGEISEEAWAKAEQDAQALYEEWKNGAATEDSFAALANEHSKDGDGTTGGLYEGVFKGQMVPAFSDWCFDPARVSGDTGIVKTNYGYHIMYFVGEGGEYWTDLVTASLKQADYSAWILEKSGEYEIQTSPFGMRFAKNI